MKLELTLAACVALAACGDPVEKSNSTTNGTNNQTNQTNQTTNNVVVTINNANNGDCTFDADCSATQACENQRCVSTCETSADCLADERCEQGESTELRVCVVSAGTSCDTRIDCDADQECIDSVCEDHFQCNSSGGGTGSGCDWLWRSCGDNKEYHLECDLRDDIQTVDCECFVNDVSTTTFVGDVDDVCPSELVHRAVNEQCGWLVNEP